MCEVPPEGVNTAANNHHHRRVILHDEEDDKVTMAIKKTGCLELNEAVIECHYDTKDWRQCMKQVKAFKACMDEYNNEQREIRKFDSLDRRPKT